MVQQMETLVIDVGGTHVKVLATGQTAPIKIDSGPEMSAALMVERVLAAVKDWTFDHVTIGYPGVVVHDKPIKEPHNQAKGWVGFDYRKAFGKPVRILNDAAMQALGAYKGRRMLFLGLGTGLGSALIVDRVIEPMELAHLPYRKGKTYEDYVGAAGLERMGKKRWRKHVARVIDLLKTAVEADYVVLGGGNARLVTDLPDGVHLGDNADAFRGGFRVWETPEKTTTHRSRKKLAS
jgi:polyphosphate glucokinase